MILSRLKNALRIPRLIRSLRRMPQSADDIVNFVMSAPVISPYQVACELRDFARIVADLRPSRVLEIGTCRGGTLCVLTRLAAPDATIISVDLPGGQFGGGYNFIRERIFRHFPQNGQKLHLVKADSHRLETKQRVLELMNGQQLDLLFIDADHTYEGVSKDYWTYAPLVRQGGVIALHDIAPLPHFDPASQVPRFWNEIKSSKDLEFIASSRHDWGGIGVIYR